MRARTAVHRTRNPEDAMHDTVLDRSRPYARTAVAAALALAVAACAEPETGGEAGEDAGAAPPGGVAELTVAEAGLQTPESVLHDADADVYLVSNINGAPLEKDDNGFISRLSPGGEVSELRWIDGAAEDVTLSAPKGMAIRGDSLFVTDIDVVRIFDRGTGEPLGEWPVEGAVFLNDPAVGPDGTLYVTDTGGEAVEQAAVYGFDDDGTPTAIAQGAELNGPNGITVDEEGITVVTFGANQVYRLDRAGERTPVAELPAGGLDGVVELADGSLLVSSWEGEAVYRVSPDGGQPATLVDGIPSPADLGYDAQRDRVLIPVFTENRIEMRPVGASAME